MIAALHDLRVAAALHDLVAAVPADIHQRGQSGLVAHHHDGNLADIAGNVVPEVRQLVRRANIRPCLTEDLVDLTLGYRRIGIPSGRQAFATLEWRQ